MVSMLRQCPFCNDKTVQSQTTDKATAPQGRKQNNKLSNSRAQLDLSYWPSLPQRDNYKTKTTLRTVLQKARPNTTPSLNKGSKNSK